MSQPSGGKPTINYDRGVREKGIGRTVWPEMAAIFLLGQLIYCAGPGRGRIPALKELAGE
jgi:hypothetical protein